MVYCFCVLQFCVRSLADRRSCNQQIRAAAGVGKFGAKNYPQKRNEKNKIKVGVQLWFMNPTTLFVWLHSEFEFFAR